MDSKSQAILEKLYQTTRYDTLLEQFKWESLSPSEWKKIREEIKKMTDTATVDNAYQFLYKVSPENNFRLGILTDVNLHRNSSLTSQKNALVTMERVLSTMWTKIRESNSISPYVLNYFRHVAWHHAIKGEMAEKENDALGSISNFVISKYFFELFENRNAEIVNNRLEIKFDEIWSLGSETNNLKTEILSLETKYAEEIKETRSANADLIGRLENLKSENVDWMSENKKLKNTLIGVQTVEKDHLEQLTKILDKNNNLGEENNDLKEEIQTLKNQIEELKSQKIVIAEKTRQKPPSWVEKNRGSA